MQKSSAFTYLLAGAAVTALVSVSSPAYSAVVTGVGIEIKGEKQDAAQPDPAEGANRAIYEFNQAVDKAAIKPVAKVYKALVPEWGRERVGSFVNNLSEPVTFVNSLLQGDVNNAFGSFWRFTINSTLGIGGLFDTAGVAGLSQRKEDFDQTLDFYGVETGPYIMLPLLGSTTLRGIFGLGVDSVTNPFNYAGTAVTATRVGTEVVSRRSDALELTDEIERTSFDPYATIRSAYFQHRKAQVKNHHDVPKGAR
jgi:phospholipid-binding lipoprotein MlaA